MKPPRPQAACPFCKAPPDHLVISTTQQGDLKYHAFIFCGRCNANGPNCYRLLLRDAVVEACKIWDQRP